MPVHKGMGGHYMLKKALKLRGTKAKSKGMEAIASTLSPVHKQSFVKSSSSASVTSISNWWTTFSSESHLTLLFKLFSSDPFKLYSC